MNKRNLIEVSSFEFLGEKAEASAIALAINEKMSLYKHPETSKLYITYGKMQDADLIGDSQAAIKYFLGKYNAETDPRITVWCINETQLGANGPCPVYFRKYEDALEYSQKKEYTSKPYHLKMYEGEMRRYYFPKDEKWNVWQGSNTGRRK